MYLKSIKAHGFKSFADKLDLEIKDGITAIVGPNGSGKSNIVDAVRWVMGEQSIKSLRGSDNMTDVIFSGSKDRNMHTRAMVALTFDNSDHYFNSDFSEIEIKRIVYKTGENEYYINNSKVRLKDITSLFLDSGAGNESFNIIGQGNIADIINSKPEARRSIFEEAAGVLKYKKRKEESLRKLEKTKENLLRINLIIDELKVTVEPLKEQSEIAKKYLSLKEELKDYEIALITTDITLISAEYEELKLKLSELNELLNAKSVESSTDNANLEKLKGELLKLEDEISNLSALIIKENNELAKLNADKNMMLERKKFEYNNDDVANVIISLKDEVSSLISQKKVMDDEFNNLNSNLQHLNKEKQEVDSELITKKTQKNNLITKSSVISKDVLILQNKIEIIEDNIVSNAKAPYAVQTLISNPRFDGIYGTIQSLIEYDNKYALAVDSALGSSLNFLVVDNNETVKNAINFLKDNKAGRATFFPVDVIKSRTVEGDVISKLSSVKGYLGVLSDYLKYDEEYKNVILNQAGNILVASDIDAMNEIASLSNYRYRVVTLEGDIVHAGGSITGGLLKKKSFINDKAELNTLKQDLDRLIRSEKDINEKVLLATKEEEEFISKSNDLSSQIARYIEMLNYKTKNIEDLSLRIDEKNNLISAQESILSHSMDDEIDKIIELYNKKKADIEIIDNKLNQLKEQRLSISTQISEEELKIKNQNSEFNKISNDIKTVEVKIGKYDVKLDLLLNSLSEDYHMTYDKAKNEYVLDLSIDEARRKVDQIKHDIRSLGEVNTGSIAEYERLGERYEFLLKQSSDLDKASEELLDVISQMDEIMINKFEETFKKISDEFALVFRKLFKGGRGILKLTNPDDILNTGIDIIAEPPGKKLNSIVMLSGGEKTLTAIAVLFAILNVKTVPFVILDEAEAALDDANVDTFGEYILEKKDKSQFILITHKKKTMEYADVLYGITMQESGVSKIVSVKLEDK